MSTGAKSRLAEFVRGLGGLQDNGRFGNLKDRVVADLGVRDPDLHEALLEAGVAQLLATGWTLAPPTDHRVRVYGGQPLEAELPPFDVGFFDARQCEGFDHVTGVPKLVAQMRRSLNHGGTVFAMLKSGPLLAGFDVYNSIVRSATEVLPSNDYLFRELLVDCTVRILSTSTTERRYETLRLLRLSLKQPTLLLILGRSHSGKTSLARDLLTHDSAMHVSNDYIYSELVARQKDGQAGHFPQRLVNMAGDGSGRACGLFNRALESDPELLRDYLEWITPLIPRNKRLVSMDFDLVAESQVELAKQVLTSNGFSVWVVRR